MPRKLRERKTRPGKNNTTSFKHKVQPEEKHDSYNKNASSEDRINTRNRKSKGLEERKVTTVNKDCNVNSPSKVTSHSTSRNNPKTTKTKRSKDVSVPIIEQDNKSLNPSDCPRNDIDPNDSTKDKKNEIPVVCYKNRRKSRLMSGLSEPPIKCQEPTVSASLNVSKGVTERQKRNVKKDVVTDSNQNKNTAIDEQDTTLKKTRYFSRKSRLINPTSKSQEYSDKHSSTSPISMKNKEQTVGGPYMCVICNNELPTIEDLRSHITAHGKKEGLLLGDKKLHQIKYLDPNSPIEDKINQSPEHPADLKDQQNITCTSEKEETTVKCTLPNPVSGRKRSHVKVPHKKFDRPQIFIEKETDITKVKTNHGQASVESSQHSETTSKSATRSTQSVTTTTQPVTTPIQPVTTDSQSIRSLEPLKSPPHSINSPPCASTEFNPSGLNPMFYPFKCEYCERRFPQRRNLRNHEIIHTGGNSVKCEDCKETFKFPCDLKEHKVAIHNYTGEYICEICQTDQPDCKTYAKHVRAHAGDKLHVCSVCNKEFSHKQKLYTHMLSHQPIDGSKHAEKKSLVQEKTRNIKQNITAENRITRRTSRIQKDNSVKHEENISKERHPNRKHQCEECEKSFTKSYNLQVHMRIHSGEKPYNCSRCGKCFSQKGSLFTHIQKLHTRRGEESEPSKKRTYICEICGRTYRKLARLSRHIASHDGIKNYKCSICSKVFQGPEGLIYHMKVHRGEKSFVCQICGASFTAAGTLKAHKRIHSGEKPYKCDYCDKYFAWPDVLKKHIRIHTGEKPYACVMCDKRFTQIAGVKSHFKSSGHKGMRKVPISEQERISTITDKQDKRFVPNSEIYKNIPRLKIDQTKKNTQCATESSAKDRSDKKKEKVKMISKNINNYDKNVDTHITNPMFQSSKPVADNVAFDDDNTEDDPPSDELHKDMPATEKSAEETNSDAVNWLNFFADQEKWSGPPLEQNNDQTKQCMSSEMRQSNLNEQAGSSLMSHYDNSVKDMLSHSHNEQPIKNRQSDNEHPIRYLTNGNQPIKFMQGHNALPVGQYIDNTNSNAPKQALNDELHSNVSTDNCHFTTSSTQFDQGVSAQLPTPRTPQPPLSSLPITPPNSLAHPSQPVSLSSSNTQKQSSYKTPEIPFSTHDYSTEHNYTYRESYTSNSSMSYLPPVSSYAPVISSALQGSTIESAHTTTSMYSSHFEGSSYSEHLQKWNKYQNNDTRRPYESYESEPTQYTRFTPNIRDQYEQYFPATNDETNDTSNKISDKELSAMDKDTYERVPFNYKEYEDDSFRQTNNIRTEEKIRHRPNIENDVDEEFYETTRYSMIHESENNQSSSSYGRNVTDSMQQDSGHTQDHSIAQRQQITHNFKEQVGDCSLKPKIQNTEDIQQNPDFEPNKKSMMGHNFNEFDTEATTQRSISKHPEEFTDSSTFVSNRQQEGSHNTESQIGDIPPFEIGKVHGKLNHDGFTNSSYDANRQESFAYSSEEFTNDGMFNSKRANSQDHNNEPLTQGSIGLQNFEASMNQYSMPENAGSFHNRQTFESDEHQSLSHEVCADASLPTDRSNNLLPYTQTYQNNSTFGTTRQEHMPSKEHEEFQNDTHYGTNIQRPLTDTAEGLQNNTHFGSKQSLASYHEEFKNKSQYEPNRGHTPLPQNMGEIQNNTLFEPNQQNIDHSEFPNNRHFNTTRQNFLVHDQEEYGRNLQYESRKLDPQSHDVIKDQNKANFVGHHSFSQDQSEFPNNTYFEINEHQTFNNDPDNSRNHEFERDTCQQSQNISGAPEADVHNSDEIINASRNITEELRPHLGKGFVEQTEYANSFSNPGDPGENNSNTIKHTAPSFDLFNEASTFYRHYIHGAMQHVMRKTHGSGSRQNLKSQNDYPVTEPHEEIQHYENTNSANIDNNYKQPTPHIYQSTQSYGSSSTTDMGQHYRDATISGHYSSELNESEIAKNRKLYETHNILDSDEASEYMRQIVREILARSERLPIEGELKSHEPNDHARDGAYSPERAEAIRLYMTNAKPQPYISRPASLQKPGYSISKLHQPLSNSSIEQSYIEESHTSQDEFGHQNNNDQHSEIYENNQIEVVAPVLPPHHVARSHMQNMLSSEKVKEHQALSKNIQVENNVPQDQNNKEYDQLCEGQYNVCDKVDEFDKKKVYDDHDNNKNVPLEKGKQKRSTNVLQHKNTTHPSDIPKKRFKLNYSNNTETKNSQPVVQVQKQQQQTFISDNNNDTDDTVSKSQNIKNDKVENDVVNVKQKQNDDHSLALADLKEKTTCQPSDKIESKDSGWLKQTSPQSTSLKNVHKCNKCEKTYATKNGLKSHTLSHKGGVMYNCELCKNQYSTSAGLKYHMKVHNNERPFECDICGSTFTHRGTLKCHKRTHTGEKPHKCEFCDKCFSWPDVLTKHRRLHTGEKPYACGTCDTSFAQIAGLKAHHRTHPQCKNLKKPTVKFKKT